MENGCHAPPKQHAMMLKSTHDLVFEIAIGRYWIGSAGSNMLLWSDWCPVS